MTEIAFDSKVQLQKIQNHMMHGEQLYAVYDMKGGNTDVLGISDVRLVFMDHSFADRGRAVVSLPYTKITAVGTDDLGSAVFQCNKILVVAGTLSWEFDFSSTANAHRAYELIMRNLLQTEAAGI